MTKAEHYQKAEEHLDYANRADLDTEGWMGDRARYHLAAAQVHAILAAAPPPKIVTELVRGPTVTDPAGSYRGGASGTAVRS